MRIEGLTFERPLTGDSAAWSQQGCHHANKSGADSTAQRDKGIKSSSTKKITDTNRRRRAGVLCPTVLGVGVKNPAVGEGSQKSATSGLCAALIRSLDNGVLRPLPTKAWAFHLLVTSPRHGAKNAPLTGEKAMLERRHCQPAASDDAGSCGSRRKQRWLGALKKNGGLLYRAAQKRRAQKPQGHETVAAQPVHSSASFERVQRLAPVHGRD